jgi:hypothetical protein
LNKPSGRKKFITSDPAQLKILSLLLISMLVPVFFVGSFLYLLIFKILSEQLPIPGFVPIAMNPVIVKTNFIITLSFIPLLLLLLIWGVIITHRLTGPLLRLQRELDEMTRGTAMKGLGVRKDDYLGPLVNSINKLLIK